MTEKECECPIDHSVTKLGHSSMCPFHGVAPPVFTVPLAFGCPPRHADGTPHDFTWATEVGETIATGVCRCGYTAMSDALWNAP